MLARGATAQKYNFGMADFIIDEGLPTEIRFDGRLCSDNSYLQADGGEISLEPETEDIVLKDFSEKNYDYVITGWDGKVTINASAYTLKLMSALFTGTYTGVDKEGNIQWITDAPIGSSMRENAHSIRIHPRQMGDDRSEDIFIYKAVNTSGFDREFDNEQASHEIELAILPKDCADASKPNNYFFIGENPKDFDEKDVYQGYWSSEDVGTNYNKLPLVGDVRDQDDDADVGTDGDPTETPNDNPTGDVEDPDPDMERKPDEPTDVNVEPGETSADVSAQ